MFYLEKEISSLKESHTDYVKNLDKVSAHIKELEAQLNSLGIFHTFYYEFQRKNYADYEYEATGLEWRKCEKSGKWRIFLNRTLVICGDSNDSTTPLIECPIDNRLYGASWLRNFLNAFKEKIDSDNFNTWDALSNIEI